MAESEIYLRENGSRLLVHPDYRNEVTGAWFNPGYWGDRARPVSSGGRGGAWFITAGSQKVVLREYLRGGLIAKISRKAYVFTGESAVRSFAEFRLLNQLVGMALPVPRPVAAWYRKTSLLRYQAALIIEKLERTTPLAELITSLDDGAWQRLGGTVRRFHDAGVRHADLNCFNVLVRDGEFFLIDFDKGRIIDGNASARWKAANLERFARSLRKVAGEAAQARVWEPFMHGYHGSQST